MDVAVVLRRPWQAGVLACVSLLACQGSADETGPRALQAGGSQVNLERVVALSSPHGDGTHFETMASEHLLGFLLGDVSRASGLAVLADVPMQLISEAEQLAQIDRLAEQENELLGMQQLGYGSEAALLALGLDRFLAEELAGDEVPPDDDDDEFPLPSSFVVAGYYDTHEKQFFVNSSVSSEYRAHVMRHELMHALQDQHFDLDQQMAARLPDLDALLAFKAVVEGQAEVAAYRAKALRPPSPSLFPAHKRRVKTVHALGRYAKWPRALGLTRSPLLCWRSGAEDDAALVPDLSLFPYNEGSLFFLSLMEAGNPRGQDFPYWVQATFRSPPATTHDILHPREYAIKRFLSPADPLDVSAFAHIADHPQRWASGLGELVARAYLWGAEDGYALAARMTRDRAVVLEQPSSTLPAVAWITQWQEARDAAAFHAFAKTAQARVDARRRRLGISPGKFVITQQENRVGLLLEVAQDLSHPRASSDNEQALTAALQQALAAP